MLSAGLPRGPVATAVGTIDTSASALDLARAVADPAVVTGASFVTRPPGGSPTAVATQAAAGFPRSGASYAIFSTGDATILTNANSSGSSGANDGGGAVRGNTDRDVTILRIDFVAPGGSNCLAGLDFRFLSEEYPEYVGSQYNDAFIAELDQSTWTTAGSSILAPRNFAFDPQGGVISINSTGATSMSAAYAETTTFDGATPVLSAATPLTPGAHSLFLSIFDQGDNIYDSAVVIDNLRFSTVTDTATQCVPGATVTNLPRPLLGAHGITGVPADMNMSLGVARGVVPGLVTRSVNTGAVDSVWQNGLTIFQEARDEAGKAGKRVNVIAHSKGGLDTRVAMWEHPQYFNMLGMLSTPNGGSTGADEVCFIRRHGGPLSGQQKQFGPCIDDTDGIFDLQTEYMAKVFNPTVRDWNYRNYYVTAGDCTGFLRISCNAGSLILLGCNDRGGDTAVCVSSAYKREINESDGLHVGLRVFDLNHTGMRQDPCPTSRIMVELYPGRNVGNPWTTSSNGKGCKDLSSTATAANSSIGVSALNSTSGIAAATPAAAASTDAVRQPVVTLAATPASPARFMLQPEGGDTIDARVYVPSGVNAQVTVVDANGNPAPGITTDTAPLFDDTPAAVHVTTIHGSGLTGRPVTVVVSVDVAAEIGTATFVASNGITLLAQIAPTATNSVTVTAFVDGQLPSNAKTNAITAIAYPPTGPVSVSLTKVGNQSGALHTQQWTGTLPVAPGLLTPIEITLTGTNNRTVFTSALTADATAAFTGLGQTQLVDTNSDGKVDELDIAVNVTTTIAGHYQLAVDTYTPAGRRLFSAPAVGDLGIGTGQLIVRVPVPALLVDPLDGPFELRDAVLTRGVTSRATVARAATLGLTGPFTLTGLVPDEITVSRPTATVSDTNADGKLDRLRFTAIAYVPVAGAHSIEANLTGPAGGTVTTISSTQTMTVGPNPITIDIDPAVITANGTGRYELGPITVTQGTNTDNRGESPSVTVNIDATQWTTAPSITGLITLWKAAFTDGSINTRGFYVSELNRLERVQKALNSGDTQTAITELDTFIAHVEDRAPKPITDPAALKIATYARTVRATLGP